MGDNSINILVSKKQFPLLFFKNKSLSCFPRGKKSNLFTATKICLYCTNELEQALKTLEFWLKERLSGSWRNFAGRLCSERQPRAVYC